MNGTNKLDSISLIEGKNGNPWIVEVAEAVLKDALLASVDDRKAKKELRERVMRSLKVAISDARDISPEGSDKHKFVIVHVLRRMDACDFGAQVKVSQVESKQLVRNRAFTIYGWLKSSLTRIDALIEVDVIVNDERHVGLCKAVKKWNANRLYMVSHRLSTPLWNKGPGSSFYSCLESLPAGCTLLHLVAGKKTVVETVAKGCPTPMNPGFSWNFQFPVSWKQPSGVATPVHASSRVLQRTLSSLDADLEARLDEPLLSSAHPRSHLSPLHPLGRLLATQSPQNSAGNPLTTPGASPRLSPAPVSGAEDELWWRSKFLNMAAWKNGSFRLFSSEELQAISFGFREENLLQQPWYGQVYSGLLNGRVVAIKRVNNSESALAGFIREVELSLLLNHPNIIACIGACVDLDRPCLVMEDTEGGTLLHRLQCSHGHGQILHWTLRFSIFQDVCHGILHLLSQTPPILLQSVDPERILLTSDYIAKIGDIGFSQAEGWDSAEGSQAISHGSEVLALGQLLVSLLVGASAMGREAIIALLDSAMYLEGSTAVLKPEYSAPAGTWPQEVVTKLVQLARRCVDLLEGKQPDLRSDILPKISSLQRTVGMITALEESLRLEEERDALFTCPITKDVMVDPVVAADGYTYERAAIEKWFQEKDTSPITNSFLADKCLRPNRNLKSSILEWRGSSSKGRWHKP